MKHLLDVRGLPPCEPFERILKALDHMPRDDTLEVLIHREPVPLYDWLRDNGFTWSGGFESTPDGLPQYRLLIRQT